MVAERDILFKKGIHLEIGGHYVVEISKHANGMYIAAYDTSTPESLLICLSSEKSAFICHQFKDNWELMANSLQIMDKRLILLNPKFVV